MDNDGDGVSDEGFDDDDDGIGACLDCDDYDITETGGGSTGVSVFADGVTVQNCNIYDFETKVLPENLTANASRRSLERPQSPHGANDI